MTILIDLRSQLMSEAIYQFLITNGYYDAVVNGRAPVDGIIPQVILVDITTVNHMLLSRYSDAKVLLVGTGVAPEQLLAVLLSLPVQGLLSTHTEMPLLEKALKAIAAGQIWIDNELVKALLQDTGALSKTGKKRPYRQGTRDHRMHLRGIKQQADRPGAALSENTVKAHLNTIFKKLNITSRIKLMTLAAQSPLARSA